MHICLINLPRFEVHRPPLSLAILSTICDDEGVDYSCIDFNLSVWQNLPKKFEQIDTFCITRQILPECRRLLTELIETTVQQQLAQHPDTIFAMSLLSTWSQPVCEIFCQVIKRLCNNKIVIGGQGLSDEYWTQDLHTR